MPPEFAEKRIKKIMDKLKIDSKNISVVVQGLIVGNSEVDESKKHTKRCLLS